MKNGLIFVIFLCLGLNFLSAQNGRMAGYVYDEETEEPLAGVNISVIGTYNGASTDEEGFYLIQGLVPGEYSIEVSFIGYKLKQITGILIEADKTLDYNIQLISTTLALGQEIEVIGKKPLMDLRETSTARSLSSDDIEKRIASDAIDLISQQVSIVKQDNAIYIRGGRAYEAQYLVDGISVQDPLSGTGFGLNVSANAIEEVEVISGGFNAEYGQATSGVIRVSTKSGSDKFKGYVSYKSDHMGLFRDQDFSFNGDQYEFNLSGPEPITNNLFKSIGLNIPGDLYFFTNFYSSISDDYTGATASQLRSSISPRLNLFGSDLLDGTSLAPRQNNNWSALLKLTWKFNPTNTFTLTYNRSLVINQNTQLLQTNLEYVEPSPGFPYDFSKNLDNFNTYTHDNEQTTLSWQHTFNTTTFSQLRFSRFFTHLRSDWDGNSWQEYLQPVDVARVPVEYFSPSTGKLRIIPGDGFYDYGNAFIWHDHYVEDYTIKGDITTIVGDIHTFKGGFESSFKEMQLIDIADAWIGNFGSGQDIYRVHPADGAFFIQDDIKTNGFILNAGVRLDWWAPGALADRSVKNDADYPTQEIRDKYMDESVEIFGRRVTMRLMPRLGVSFPISSNQMLYFNYGHFSKRPKPQFVYAKLASADILNSFSTYGNPSLSPETSVKYELGVRHKFGEDNVLTATAFYKDIFDYVQTVTGELPRIGTAIFYVNRDYARSRGIELEYKTRIGQYLFGNLSTSFSLTTTKSSSANVGTEVAKQELAEVPIGEIPAAWDRPWNVGANLSIVIPANHNPSFLGVELFSDWTMNMRFFAQAGKRYTPQYLSGIRSSDGRPLYSNVTDQSKRYSKVATSWHWVDLNFTKYLHLLDMRFGLYLEIKNLFNSQNAQIINPVTGEAYKYGDSVPSGWNDPLYPDRTFPVSSPFPLDPSRYSTPRNIRFGVSAEF